MLHVRHLLKIITVYKTLSFKLIPPPRLHLHLLCYMALLLIVILNVPCVFYIPLGLLLVMQLLLVVTVRTSVLPPVVTVLLAVCLTLLPICSPCFSRKESPVPVSS